MSLIVAVPFSDGMIVSADCAGQYHAAKKLYTAGGRLFTGTNACAVVTRAGRIVFSLEATIAASWPEQNLEPEQLPELTKRTADLARKRWPVTQPLQEALVVFWFSNCCYSFTIENRSGAVSCSKVTPHALGARRYFLQGMVDYVEEHVIRARRLTAASYAWLSSRDLSLDHARAFALDVQQTAERTLQIVHHPHKIGGGVDFAIVRADGAKCPCGSGVRFPACHGASAS